MKKHVKITHKSFGSKDNIHACLRVVFPLRKVFVEEVLLALMQDIG